MKRVKLTFCRKSWVFSGYSGFLPQGKLTGWDRYYGPTVIGSRCCGDPALVTKLNNPPPKSCQQAKSFTDILSTSQKANRHLVNKPKALPTTCQQAKNLTDNLSTSQTPNQHLVNMPNAQPTSYQHVKSPFQSLSTYQKTNSDLINMSKV